MELFFSCPEFFAEMSQVPIFVQSKPGYICESKIEEDWDDGEVIFGAIDDKINQHHTYFYDLIMILVRGCKV